MSVTPFQKFHIDYNHEADVPLDYPSLSNGGFESINFRPEEGVDIVAKRIDYARKQRTFRDELFDGNIWLADPSSSSSVNFGIPKDAKSWGTWIIDFVHKLTNLGYPPRIVKLNIEFTGKGYPPWKPKVTLPAWSHVWANVIDPMDARVKPFLFVTPSGGITGSGTPSFELSGATIDGTLNWVLDGNSIQPYPYAKGWLWNEVAAKTLFEGLPGQLFEIQPMGGQIDFNHGVWMKYGARNSPQCYGSQPYIALRDLDEEIYQIVNNVYVMPYYGFSPDRRKIHPTIGAFGQGRYYRPSIKNARTHGVFGVRLFPHNNLDVSDYIDYRSLVVP